MQIVPVRATPNQILTAQLSGQPTRLMIYQRLTSLYMDIYVNDVLLLGGALCLNARPIVRSVYLGFIGDLAFFDNQPSPLNGPSDPDYTGLGARWPLYYFTPSEIDPGAPQ